MTGALVWEFEERADSIYIHFDVADHYLSLDTFVKSAESARNILQAMNVTFFNDGLKYELMVLPPAEGTFLAKLGVLVGFPAVVFGFLNSEIGGAYVEGLTGRSPSDWAKSFGESHRALFEGEPEGSAGSDETISEYYVFSEFFEETCFTETESSKYSSQVVVAMARGILEKEGTELVQIGMEIGALPDALDARSDFYTACVENNGVKRVGFTPEDDFPIPRSSFPDRARRLTRTPKDEDEPMWLVSIEVVFVTSPNWDREDQKSRQWKGRYQNGRDCYFVIDDSEFWLKVKRKDIQPELLDKIKVQWRLNTVNGRPKNIRVLRVLEYNGEKLSDPLPTDSVRALIGQYSEHEDVDKMPKLL